jgi:hypothetical protein
MIEDESNAIEIKAMDARDRESGGGTMTLPAARLEKILHPPHDEPPDGRCDACDLLAELDSLLAEVDRLRAEKRQLRARLVECLPWVGCTPYPNTRGFSEMIAARDLANDTLVEVEK